MKKQTQVKWATGVLLIFLIAVVSETGFSGVGKNSSGNRWEYRFKKDNPDVTAPSTTPTPATTPNIYGSENLKCRDSFVLMNTRFDSKTDLTKSRISVPPLVNGEAREYNCTDANPPMTTSTGLPVLRGKMVVRCMNGTAILESANCVAKTQAEKDAEDAEKARLAELERQRLAELERQRLAELERQRIAAEKAAAEKAAAEAAAAAHAAANPQCYGCSASATCVKTSTVDISKNSSVTRRTTYYACSNGNSRVVYNSGSSGCVTGQVICSSSSSGK